MPAAERCLAAPAGADGAGSGGNCSLDNPGSASTPHTLLHHKPEAHRLPFMRSASCQWWRQHTCQQHSFAPCWQAVMCAYRDAVYSAHDVANSNHMTLARRACIEYWLRSFQAQHNCSMSLQHTARLPRRSPAVSEEAAEASGCSERASAPSGGSSSKQPWVPSTQPWDGESMQAACCACDTRQTCSHGPTSLTSPLLR